MFAKSDGPTALRADLVRALAFSEAKVERPGSESLVEAVAALAAVWNGRKGYVALLVRDVDPPRIDRYVTENAITSPEALDEATREAVAFAESLGFTMDAPAFAELSEDAREARLHRWNKLRKLRKPGAQDPAPGDSGALEIPDPPPIPEAPSLPDLTPIPAGLEISPDELSVPPPTPVPEIEASPQGSVRAEGAEAPADPEAETSLVPPGARSAVLGRISLVRRGGADARRLEQLARLIGSF